MKMTVDDAAVVYEHVDVGEGEPPVLFLHGVLGVRGQFAAVGGRFAERSQIRLDFPSHGESAVSGDGLSTERLASYTLRLLDSLGVEGVDVIGYSMGGYVGIEMALLAPGRVRTLVSHAMKFFWTPEAIASTLEELRSDALRERSQRGFDALAAMHSPVGLESTLQHSRSIISSFGQRQLSPEVVRAAGIPLLLSVGDRDELVPLREVVALFDALDCSRSTLTVHPGTPHPFHLLPLDCFEHAVRKFWAFAQKTIAA